MADNQNLAIQIVFDSFKNNIKSISNFLKKVSDSDLQNEVSNGKNTGHYLLGHLIAVHDKMIPLLGFGESLYPDLIDIFIKNPDNKHSEKPLIEQLRKQWNSVNLILLEKLESLRSEEWFDKHNSVTHEDFAKEPKRNKLNVVLSRSIHLAYHGGQLKLLKNIQY